MRFGLTLPANHQENHIWQILEWQKTHKKA